MPVMSFLSCSTAPAVRMWVTSAPLAWEDAAVASAPRRSVKTFPTTPVTRMISASILIRNCGAGGKRTAEVTMTVVATGVIPPIWLIVV
jgi:hypothetical protein